MRILVYALVVLSVSSYLMGSMFKIMHWPGANIMLILGLSLTALVTVPLSAYYLFIKRR